MKLDNACQLSPIIAAAREGAEGTRVAAVSETIRR
jgi:hypothetical protein